MNDPITQEILRAGRDKSPKERAETAAKISKLMKRVEMIRRKARRPPLLGPEESLEDYARRQGYHAGIMCPVNDYFEMETAEGYFPDAYLEHVEDFEQGKKKEEKGEYKIINSWFSDRLDTYVIIGEHVETKKRKAILRDRMHFVLSMMHGTTVLASSIWKEKTEARAMEKLKTHLRPDQYATYFLTGSFVEQSKKSRVYYIFRRCRPTVACVWTPDGWKYLAGLCMHPVGYYRNSWCGGMVPSDDIIAHLLMMRADEHGFWKKSNHHEYRAATVNV